MARPQKTLPRTLSKKTRLWFSVEPDALRAVRVEDILAADRAARRRRRWIFALLLAGLALCLLLRHL